MYADTLKKVLLIVLVLFTHICSASAQGKNFFISRNAPSWIVKIDPDDHVSKPKDVSDGYYASLLEKQSHAELQEEYTHIFREIVSDAGVQNGSEISVTYDPSYQKLTFHQITVWRNGHPADKLIASKFKVLQNEKELSKFIYSGTYDAYLILDDIRKGDRIEFSFTIKGNNPVFGDKYSDDFYFEGSTSAARRYTNLIVSKNRKLNFKNFNFNTQPKISEKDGLKLYEWESKNTNTYRTAKFEPSWYNPFKHTQISEYQSWNEVVNWGLKVNSYANLQTPLLDKKVQELQLKAKNDPKKYMELAIHFVQDEVRYMGIEMGQYSQRPNSPEKVLQQRYGDCKDKSLLLIYLLKRANINAYMAYIDTYNGKKINTSLPSAVLFNHAVVLIEYKNQKKWIDATISYQRGSFDQIYFPDYGQGLVLKPGVTHLENVISKPSGKQVANLTFDVGDTGSVKKTKLVIKSTYTGNKADDIRSTIADEGVDGIEKLFLEYISGYYPDTETNGAIKIKDNEQTNTIEITESYLIPDVWQKEDKKDSRYYAYFYGDLIDHSIRYISAKNRTQPMALKNPVNIEQNVFVHFPESWTMNDESFESKSENFAFKYNSVLKDKLLTVNYSYRSIKDHIEAKDVRQYIKETDELKDKLSYGLYWGGSGKESPQPDEYNNYLFLLAVIVFVASGFYFLKVYQEQYLFDINQLTAAKPISGSWLTLITIGLRLELLYLLVHIVGSTLFEAKTWDTTAGFEPGSKYFIETAYTIIAITYSVRYAWLILLVILITKRREIFPMQFTRFLIFSTIAVVFEFAVRFFVHTLTKKPTLDTADFIEIPCWIIFSTIWIVYLENSRRIRETFVFTYPELLWKTEMIKQANEQFHLKSKNENL